MRIKAIILSPFMGFYYEEIVALSKNKFITAL